MSNGHRRSGGSPFGDAPQHPPSLREAPRESWQQGPSLLESMWRYRWLLLVVGILAGLAGYGLSLTQPTRYQASAVLMLADQESTSVFGSTLRPSQERYVTKQSERVQSTPVLAQASQILGGSPSAGELRGRVSAEPLLEVDQVIISATDPTADGAAAIADAVAVAYQQSVSEEVSESVDEAIAQITAAREELEDRIDQLEDDLAVAPDDFGLNTQLDAAVQQLAALQTRTAELAVDGALRGSGVELFEPATVPDTPVQPRPRRNAALAAFLGLAGAGAFAYWRAGKTHVAETSDDPGEVLDAPLLGEIPVLSENEVLQASIDGSGVLEPYQFVVSSLEFALASAGGSAVLFTSPGPGDGKTVTALNTALAAHRDGRRILLVDGDLRARGLSRVTKTASGPGLSDLAADELPAADCIQALSVADAGWLPVVAAGSQVKDPAGFFRTPDLRKALMRLRESADLVLVDSPPLLAVSDTSAVAGQVDGIVLVVNRGTQLSQLEAVRDRLAFIGTPLLGYVFNRASRRGPYQYGYPYTGSGANRRGGWLGRGNRGSRGRQKAWKA